MAAVQFNLIPDVKYEYLKAKRFERATISISIIVVAVCIVVLAALVFFADFKQKHDISGLSSDITNSSRKIQSINGLDKIITIQNQLESLPALYEQDPSTSRIFSYITQLTPPNVTVGDLTLDFTANTMEIKGQAPALSDVNSYTDALKEATYNDKTSGVSSQPAFSSVVLSTFARSDQGATYTIDMSFDPTLFKTDDTIVLTVPKKTNLPQVPGLNGQIFKALPKNSNSTPTQGSGGQNTLPTNSGQGGQ